MTPAAAGRRLRLPRHRGPALPALIALLALTPLGCRSEGELQLPGQHLRMNAAPMAVAADTPPPARETPAVPAPVAEQTIELPAVLAWAGAENPTIALAREAVRAGEAERLQAMALLLPTLNAGSSTNVHRGNLLTSQGIIRNVDRQSAYVGAGALAVGTGTVIFPGVRLTAPLADAVFEPRVARERLAGLRLDAVATRNQVLLDAVSAYLTLAGAEARIRALQRSDEEFREVARLTANFARSGQGRQGDADRAESEALLLEAQIQRSEEEIAVAAAELARILHADPSIRFRPADSELPLVQLVDPTLELPVLVSIAVRRRPEVGAATAAIRVGQTRLRQEQVRPFVPTVSAGFSAGAFGGGSDQADTTFGNFSGRTDFDVLAYWTLQNFGLGNRATQNERRAAMNQAMAAQRAVINRVGREVADARARAAARLQEVEVARRRIATAAQGYQQDLLRARNLQGRPIELINSLTLLNNARQDLVRATTAYDIAQFQLFVALGQPPDVGLGAACAP